MLMKLTTSVNFINVFRALFSYGRKSFFGSFFKLRVGFGKKFVRKMHAFNVDEIDGDKLMK